MEVQIIKNYMEKNSDLKFPNFKQKRAVKT